MVINQETVDDLFYCVNLLQLHGQQASQVASSIQALETPTEEQKTALNQASAHAARSARAAQTIVRLKDFLKKQSESRIIIP